MLGRREEEAEREEVERQLREVEEQEAMALAGEEEARRRSMLARGEGQGQGERDLDEDIPDAEQMTHGGEEENEMGERDMDDDVPDADEAEGDQTNVTFGDTTTTTDLLLEGETGITDDVEGTSLGQPGPAVPSVIAGGGAAFREFDAQEQEALANAMMDEDEQGMAERDLDNEVPSAGGLGERDLDDDVPEAEAGDEGEWQHTDTEEEGMDEDESGLDISNLEMIGHARLRGVTPGQSSVAMPQTSESMGSPGSGRRWFSGGARRNLFGRGSGNLFGLTPPQQQPPDSAQLSGPPAAPRRRNGRAGRENRDSLD